MVQITPTDLERYVARIAHPDFNIENERATNQLIGHLKPNEYDAVLTRAAAIVRARAQAIERIKMRRVSQAMPISQ